MGNIMRSQGSGNNDRNINPVLKASNNDFLVVLRDYPSADISQPIFRMGERLRVLADEGYWVKVHSVQTDTENYIPNSHVAKIYHGWLFEGVSREKAEELLRLPGNRVGSFMVRESARERGVYSLSVMHRCVMHYRILRLPNNWYYISPRLTFQCLEDLVNHYSDSADGLCCVLTTPCLSITSTNTQNLGPAAPVVVMRRNLPQSNADSRKSETVNYSTHNLQGGTGDLLSFGVRNSIASYLSLAESESPRPGKSNRKKKSKTVYVMQDHDLSHMALEED
ncbi:hypothetical protein MATL_G00235730 [Megalops atlanticus]|uniref:SH2 domain-containing protein n=1 Tax=Megalops atlanticus TaxID=7932 RepID=A0A9D3T2R7_MEGAT|nr:hypothetical protein MATL_G00235730 [Megalops atlanticus]